MRNAAALTVVFALLFVDAAFVRAADQPAPARQPIVGMNTPALSPDGSTICFSYQGDLWTVPAIGGTATRITIHPAHDAYPRWSPDGRWIAFASNRYPGPRLNYDVFVMPAMGGEPRRITYHTNNDYPFDWSPDGKRLLIQGPRGTGGWQAIEINAETLAFRSITDDRNYIRYPVYAPDGRTIAFNRSGRAGAWWRPRYRGSAAMDIWIKAPDEPRPTRFTDYDGTDLWPMFSADGKTLFYVSDVLSRGVPNVVKADLNTRKIAAVTRHDSGAVTWPNIARNGSAIVYINSGDLYVVSLREGTTRKVDVYAASDVKMNRSERLTLTSGATELEVSPDGKTLGLVVRGDIWTVPADKGGDARRLTRSPANDNDFVWSPDSAHIAFVSDRDGLFALYVVDVRTGDERRIAGGAGDVSSPHWSPDGKSIAYLLGGPEPGLYLVSADGTGEPRKLAPSYGNNRFGVGITSHAWAPDSRWIAFARRDVRNTTDVWVVPVSGGEAVNVTMYPGSNEQPQWSADGRFLTFLSSRDRPSGRDLYAVPLQRTDAQATKDGATGPKEITIDFEEIELRSKRLTLMGVAAYDLAPDGKTAFGVGGFGPGGDHFAVPLAGGEVQRLSNSGDAEGAPRFGATSDRYWCLVRGGTVRSYRRQGPGWAGSPLAFEARRDLDRVAERAQVFAEFWRSLATGFSDPKMHGVDWDAVRARYERLLPGAWTTEEMVFFILSPMAGELNASHAEVSPSVTGSEPEVAELGLVFDETHPGPGLRVKGYVRDGPNGGASPIVKPGEYILAIGDTDVSLTETMWSALAGRADKETELLVNAKPSREGARTVKMKPVTSARIDDLQYEQDVRDARARVEALSKGRLAYINIRSMDGPSLQRMERELWGMAQTKDGLILDVRGNGGGSTHDAVLAQLARASYGFTQPRDGPRSTQPWRHWDRPVVLLTDENSMSDAEILAMGFRELKLGKIVGTRTPGYVIGTYSDTLQDGTSYRIPMWRWYDARGKDLENEGVAPDVAVERSGRDAESDEQLAAAVSILLKELGQP
ncbi:MAG: hypothetical protein GX446_15380 [Chthonomonadales bacterium]|nr:hypothetical protein [Chthonomonadales bacterium]